MRSCGVVQAGERRSGLSLYFALGIIRIASTPRLLVGSGARFDFVFLRRLLLRVFTLGRLRHDLRLDGARIRTTHFFIINYR